MKRFDFDALRLVCNIKLAHEIRAGKTKTDVAREIGMDSWSFSKFLHGQKPTVGVDHAMTLMTWVGYEKFSDFEKED